MIPVEKGDFRQCYIHIPLAIKRTIKKYDP
jgi:hypothetical protein